MNDAENSFSNTRTQGIWRPRAGDWVQVRSAAEIVATLDGDGDYEQIPFMPEMLEHVGHRFQVSAVAHKTCDTINGTGGRRLRSAVHLANLRCSGAAHGGCQAECLLFWKTSWLKPVEDVSAPEGSKERGDAVDQIRRGLAPNASRSTAGTVTKYRCQATQLFNATEPLPWWDLRQYWKDVRSGNVTLSHALSVLFLACVFNLRRLPVAYRLNCWLYERAHQWIHHEPDPHLRGSIPKGQSTPDERIDLKIGALVEIRHKDEIAQTINEQNRNRGLQIDEEMTTYCGRRYRVSARVERIINERTGEMMQFNNPCIVLEGVYCMGNYSNRRLLCPRRITTYWREAWLRPVHNIDDPRDRRDHR